MDPILSNIDEEYVTAGWLLGDGWQLSKVYGVCFGPTELKAQEVVLRICNGWHAELPTAPGGVMRTIKSQTQANGVVMWQTSKQSFLTFIQEKFGMMPHKSPEKIIPEKIMIGTRVQQAAFLSGLFSADGCMHVTEKTPFVSLSSASRHLLQNVCLLLKSFDIHSVLTFGPVTTRPGRSQGSLRIHGYDNLAKFHNTIGFFLCPPKQEKLAASVQLFVPKKMSGVRPYFRVISVESAGMQPVYDLSVPDGHHFVANGMVTHNCNLSSIALPKFVNQDRTDVDYAGLMDLVRIVTRNMNAVIDASYYPLPEMATSNLNHRPIGLGVQGLADVFFMLRVPFTSPRARHINRRIFKCIYYAAAKESMELAKERGHYSSFPGSPASQGRLQPELWGVDPEFQDQDLGLDWATLRADIQKYGMTNSLLVAPMPTASTAQILGNVECFEAQTSNLYTRRVLSGEFIVINRHLVSHLQELGLWSEETRQAIMVANGSVQTVSGLPQDVKDIYKTVWEISQKDIIEMAAERGPYIDQSQSLNIHFTVPDMQRLTSLHMRAWELGLKTGMYYLRTRPAADPLKSTVSGSVALPQTLQAEGSLVTADAPAAKRPRLANGMVCTDEVCTMCSS